MFSGVPQRVEKYLVLILAGRLEQWCKRTSNRLRIEHKNTSRNANDNSVYQNSYWLGFGQITTVY